jgi:hypothetical protein
MMGIVLRVVGVMVGITIIIAARVMVMVAVGRVGSRAGTAVLLLIWDGAFEGGMMTLWRA